MRLYCELFMKTSKQFNVGLISAILCLLAVSTHPVIIDLHSEDFDVIFYTFCTVFFEFILSTPVLMYELLRKRHHINQNYNDNTAEIITPTNARIKRPIFRFLIIGGIFSIAQLFVTFGLESADATTAAIAFKSSMIFTIIFGFVFLKEEVSITQIIFTAVIFVALYYSLSKGTFTPLKIDFGAIILVLVPLLWTVGHTMTKPLLQEKISSPTEVIWIRTGIGSSILAIVYFGILANPISTFSILLRPANLINVILIGLAYLMGHLFWYYAIKNTDIALSSAIQAPQPIITAILSTLVQPGGIYGYQVIGISFIVTSILIIIFDKRNQNISVYSRSG
ncbi:MAG: EamA family transporter [Candidatus Lokiarchaeota archaeon]|nr:EamA family transporter [Candidatus Lokiarchaeota archaeon]